MGSLLVITGPPGAGKSTLAPLVADQLGRVALVEADVFFAFVARGGIDPWRPEAHEQNQAVVRAAGAAAGRYALGGYSTIYDGVLGPWFLSDFIAATGLLELDYAIVLPPVEECVRRVMTRTNHGFRNEPAARKMHAEFADAEIDLRHIIATADEEPLHVAETILTARADGSLRVAV